MTLKIVTANRLGDGKVVYLAQSGEWSERLTAGRAAEGKAEEAALLAVAAKAEEELLVVASYLMPVDEVDGGLKPLSQRERIRAIGPSVRSDFGDGAIGAGPHGQGAD